MKRTRRKFLKVAGAAALGVAAAPALEAATGFTSVASANVKGTFKPNESKAEAKHWAMVIDTRKLAENPEIMKGCIEKCHTLHNVPEIPSIQNVKWLWEDSFHHTFTEKANDYLSEEVHERSFPLLCNHCEHPPCVRVCPTKATFKRDSDGIVLMDFHRCIGCRFCMAACPFGARSFNFMDPRPYIKETNPLYPTRMRGVVEKCNFCAERLAKGEIPACVEVSEGALTFGDLADPESEVRALLKENFTIRRKPTLGTSPSVYYII